MNLVDVRCPLPDKRKPAEVCNKLCVRVETGSSGKAYCRVHDTEFEFQVDDSNAFNDIISNREAESGQTATTEHP